jgi:hypothetical protein
MTCGDRHFGCARLCAVGLLSGLRIPLVLLCLLLSVGVARPQGTVAMNTGGSLPLLTEVVLLPAPLLGDRLEFEFGFSTSEVFAPEAIFDSFTVTLQSLAATQALILATIDVSGAAFAPGGGGIDIPADDITRTTTTYPSLSPVLAVSSAYVVSVPIVPELIGAQLQVFFDLFDNQNAVASQGYFRNVALVTIPEPSSLALEGIATVAAMITLRGRRAGKERRA